MQELISKSEATKLVRDNAHIFKDSNQMIALEWLINSLPTTVHHEYKVGDMAEFANYWSWFTIWKFNGYCCDGIAYDLIRPLSKEHPDITQARELASRHWFQLTKI